MPARAQPTVDREAERVVSRGSLPALLAEVTSCGDILVVGEDAVGVGIDLAYRPACPVVVVPAQPAGQVAR
jgi:hypothetical protein